MKSILVGIAIIGLFACGNPQVIQTLQQQSVGQIPCNASHIEVIEHVIKDDGSATWMALCNGKTYSCQRSSETAEATCSQMESQMPE